MTDGRSLIPRRQPDFDHRDEQPGHGRASRGGTAVSLPIPVVAVVSEYVKAGLDMKASAKSRPRGGICYRDLVGSRRG